MELNPEQARAVKAPPKPILVIAPAGTGKTRVLTERIIYLIESNIAAPDEILAITFTNLAANEMVSRVENRIKDKHRIPDAIGTIHSLFGEILRKDIGLVCRNRNFNFEITYGDFQDSIFRKALNKAKTESKFSRYSLKDLKDLVSKYKISMHLGTDALTPIELHKVREVFDEYEKILEEKNLLDFDDVLIFVDKLFHEVPIILEFWQNKYKAILVDECQDLDEIQFRIIRKLVEKENPNFFAVGDPNQCIFIFKGAKENIFEEFKNLFEDFEEIELVTNYRSDKSIVKYSNEKKILPRPAISKAHSKEQGCISFLPYVDNLLKEKLLIPNIDLSRWSVLFRYNNDARFLVDQLIENRIPFRTSHFYLLEDPAIEKIVNYLKVIYFDNSKPLKTILHSKDLALDKHTVKEICAEGNYVGSTLFSFLIHETEWLDLPISDSDISKLGIFLERIKRLRRMEKDYLAGLVESIVPIIFMGKITPATRDKIDLFILWLDTIQVEKTLFSAEEIVVNMISYAEISKEDINAKRHNYLTLSTIHKTKGLEWENVIVLRYEELQKSSTKSGNDKYLEYVAITRAKNNLFLIQ
ncbi:ATP-dependent DNA helicase UvrD/PcrA [Mycoplasma haemofelis str. Langford 1]|uniref:DNA 3'-5' helicase n=2 Tax=Mycoplasma haemofelis TaxID=29501 RepID=F6FH15_MYCHI|nr:ATP-dependent helicase [Mycoplasma haemofelis]AEG73724.1 ATP-dependent DNA helicase UvrD/PcrA [Mycoplasma haemofelis Ohio2]CBY93428.1 ATP-dependent DNA helicase UvrD/PcrA [Mycoplasma haemofelis str. Langford 1]